MFINAGVVELVDTLDLGSSVARRESSSLSFRTKQYKSRHLKGVFFLPKFFAISCFQRINNAGKYEYDVQ